MNNMSKGYYEIKERIQQLKLSTEELKVYYRNADGSFSKSFPQILNILSDLLSFFLCFGGRVCVPVCFSCLGQQH